MERSKEEHTGNGGGDGVLEKMDSGDDSGEEAG